MTRILRELTAGASSWSVDVISSVKQAVGEIAKLREQEKQSLIRPEAPTTQDLEAFKAWLATHVKKPATVTIEHVGSEGYGLKALEDIKEDDEFISVPYGIVLGTHMALGPAVNAAEWAEVASDPLLTRFPSCMLAVRLLAEAAHRKRASFFQPYVAILPASFDIPLFYDASDFEALEGSAAFDSAVKLLYNSIKQFLYIEQLVQTRWRRCPIPVKSFTLANYFWALGAVLTRQNEVVIDDRHAALALIPGWDMCNHEQSERITTFSDPKLRVISCNAIRAFSKDEQVTMYYGPRSNDQLLVYSGFVMKNNPHDFVSIQLSLREDDPLLKIRRLLIQKEAAISPAVGVANGIRVSVNAQGDYASPAMLRALQIAFMDKANLTQALRQSAEIVKPGSLASYDWSDEEKSNADKALIAGCESAQLHLRSRSESSAHATRGELLKQYWAGQLDVVNALLQKRDGQ
ncbi:hypothetical protein Poli38472_008538 [Pythium oligandrum]|uniref:protein-histidine N-methyltransferase n=1 Tax=Pythium oligandrum TaxID=41045 RepID=A0A8K1FA50_PYTOL|nr:hypothetical protein Poli38472_008538 [Pythium oligandrum]|eukprot:TMW55890.1 hypothetical protein Poli38472_008538 [Pythium oligandrum]